MPHYVFRVRESKVHSADYHITAGSPEEAMAKYKAKDFRRDNEQFVEEDFYVEEIVDLSKHVGLIRAEPRRSGARRRVI